jgi:hypothetical protein
MHDVGESVSDLPLCQGPARPVGKPRGFVERGVSKLADERLVTCRVAEAAHHRGNLRVKKGRRDRAHQIEEDLNVLPRCMKHFQSVLIGHERQ